MKLKAVSVGYSLVVALWIVSLVLQVSAAESPREHLSLDPNRKFHFGHATDVKKDFNHATGGFSYWAKTGFGSGASGTDFKDRDWRQINLPHDWTAELPFNERGSGKEILTTKVETTGQPAANQLVPHRASLKADGEDVSVITAQGRMVATANHLISFELSGPGKIKGVGNDDPSSHEPEQFLSMSEIPSPVWQRSLFNGLAQIIAQSTKDAGEIKLTAKADDLTAATTSVNTQPCTPRPSVP